MSRDGLATLCKNEADARMIASNGDRDYPRGAPYRAALLGDVAAEKERWTPLAADLRHMAEKHEMPVGTTARYSLACGPKIGCGDLTGRT